MGLSGPLSAGRSSWSSRTARAWRWWTCSCTSRIGTATEWGELEQSAAMETTNIVGCAYLNALAAHLPGKMSRGGRDRRERGAGAHAADLPPRVRRQPARVRLDGAGDGARPGAARPHRVRGEPAGTEPELDAAVHPRPCVAAGAGGRRWPSSNLTDTRGVDRALAWTVRNFRRPPALVSVAIGQWAVAAAPAKIRTLLGSCVGRGALRPGRPPRRPGPHRPARLAGCDRPPRQVRRHGDPRHDRRDRAAAPGEGPRPAGRQARGGRQHVRHRRRRRTRR